MRACSLIKENMLLLKHTHQLGKAKDVVNKISRLVEDDEDANKQHRIRKLAQQCGRLAQQCVSLNGQPGLLRITQLII